MAPTTFANRARMSTSTVGTGTITLGNAQSGYASFAEAGISNGDTVAYTIEDGNNFETGHGVYTASGTTLTRVPILSKIAGEAADTGLLSLSGSAKVFVTFLAEDIAAIGNASFPPSSTDNAVVRWDGAGATGVQNSGVIIDDSNNVTGIAALTMSGVLTVQGAVVIPAIHAFNFEHYH